VPAGEPARAAAGSRWYGQPAGAMAGKGPVRGFPPAPGQPPPLYPPGQFSAWNRAARQPGDGYRGTRRAGNDWADTDTDSRYPASTGHWYAEPDYPDAGPGGGAGPGASAYADPGYSVLAVSDPAADVTSTQTWEAVDAAQPWDAGTTQSWDAGTAQPWDAAPGQDRPGGTAEPAASGWAGQPGQRAGRPQAESFHEYPAGPAGTVPADRPDQAGPPGFGQQDSGSRPGPGSPAGPAAQAGGRAAPRDLDARADRPSARRAQARARRRKRSIRLLLAGGLAIVVVVGGAAYFVLSGHSGSGQAANAAQSTPAQSVSPTATPTPTPSLGPWGHIATRAADPLALSLAELFPARFTSAGASYGRTVQRSGTKCVPGVIGSKLQAAIRKAKCTQVMRASYLSGKLMGTIGVLNLVSVTAAERAGKAAGGGDFIAQLAAAKGPTHHLTKGTGLEETEIKGHYLVLVWAEFTSLRAPKTKAQRSQIVNFCNRVIQNTANLSLASREVTGKPRTP
jgi:hypothetical protein